MSKVCVINDNESTNWQSGYGPKKTLTKTLHHKLMIIKSCLSFIRLAGFWNWLRLDSAGGHLYSFSHNTNWMWLPISLMIIHCVHCFSCFSIAINTIYWFTYDAGTHAICCVDQGVNAIRFSLLLYFVNHKGVSNYWWFFMSMSACFKII